MSTSPTPPRPRVLLITRSDDNASVGLVSNALIARGAEPIRFDSDRYPLDLRLSTWLGGGRVTRRLRLAGLDTGSGSGAASGSGSDLGEACSLDGLTAVWYRRFFAGGRLPVELGDLREPAVNEARRTLWGTIAALGAFEMDPLVAVRGADHKELQLRRAMDLGLAIPRTLITSSPDDARRFVREAERPVVAKVQSSFAVWRGREELVVYTTEVREDDLAFADGLRYSPMVFQERVPKRFDVRATVVGRRVLAARLDSQRAVRTAVDWRRDGVGTIDDWEAHALPDAVERSLLDLTAAFGLHYAAADFVLTPEGEHVFLEINAGGEWLWLAERPPHLPIPEAIADVLLGLGARHGRGPG